MCVGCGGPSENENRAHFHPDCIERRKKYPYTPKESKDYPPVEIDRHGLVWVCGVILVNLYQSARHAELAKKVSHRQTFEDAVSSF